MRVHVVDPSAYTPPYDHAFCTALAAAGVETELVTSKFAYAEPTRGDVYRTNEFFYRHVLGRPGSRLRLATKSAQHVIDMLRYRRYASLADLVHFQWLSMQQVDTHLLPHGRPLVLTAHDVLPREPRIGQVKAQRKLYERMDAVVVHSQHGSERLTSELGIERDKIHVIPHGAFEHLTAAQDEQPLPAELAAAERPVVLFFGLLRPYKGLDTLLEAWRGISDAELWIVGMPRMPLESLWAGASDNVRFVQRFVSDAELPAYFRRADLVVLPYREIDQSGVLYTALAFNKPMILSAVGGFPEVAATGAAELVPPGDPAALHTALVKLLADPGARERMSLAARSAAQGRYSWQRIAEQTVSLYRALIQ